MEYFFIGVFVLSGLGVFIIGLKQKLFEAEAMRSWKRTEGIVIEIEVIKYRQKNGFTGYYYHPIIQFCADSMSHEIKGGRSNIKLGIDVGCKMDVMYDPKNPKNVFLKYEHTDPFLIVFGTVILLVGIGLLIAVKLLLT